MLEIVGLSPSPGRFLLSKTTNHKIDLFKSWNTHLCVPSLHANVSLDLTPSWGRGLWTSEISSVQPMLALATEQLFTTQTNIICCLIHFSCNFWSISISVQVTGCSFLDWKLWSFLTIQSNHSNVTVRLLEGLDVADSNSETISTLFTFGTDSANRKEDFFDPGNK